MTIGNTLQAGMTDPTSLAQLRQIGSSPVGVDGNADDDAPTIQDPDQAIAKGVYHDNVVTVDPCSTREATFKVGSITLAEVSPTPTTAKPVDAAPENWQPVILATNSDDVDKAIANAPSSGKTEDLGTVLPEDGTLQANDLEMSFDPSDKDSLPYLKLMAEIGVTEGFGLTIHTNAENSEALVNEMKSWPPESRAAVTIVSGHFDASVWSQDAAEPTTKGKMVLPMQFPEGYSMSDLSAAIRKGRAARGTTFPMITQGQVGSRREFVEKADVALAKNMTVVQGQTYVEGGNLQPGTMSNNERFAIVGKDSETASKVLMEKTLGRPVSKAEVKEKMAQDLGIKPENLTFIEQPGDFHLDMAIIPLPNKGVVLNDAMAVAKMQVTWLREDHEKARPPAGSPEFADWKKAGVDMEVNIKDVMSKAKKLEGIEHKTQLDLEKAGFKVYHMAGVFPKVGDALPPMNFMNTVQITNKSGNRVNIHLGGDQRAEAYVQKQLTEVIPTGIKTIHFLDRKLTPDTLRLMGGICCRVKMSHGTVVTPTSVSGDFRLGTAPVPKTAVRGLVLDPPKP